MDASAAAPNGCGRGRLPPPLPLGLVAVGGRRGGIVGGEVIRRGGGRVVVLEARADDGVDALEVEVEALGVAGRASRDAFAFDSDDFGVGAASAA